MDLGESSQSGAGITKSPKWVSSTGVDAAKAGLLLYVIGLLASSLYYSQFSILTLDLAKPQCILIGAYIVILYAVLPGAILFTAKDVRHTGVIPLIFGGALGVLDIVFAWEVGYRNLSLVCVTFLTVALQFFLFCDLASIWRSLVVRSVQVTFLLPPRRMRTFLITLVACVHFSFSWFPQIPAYMGGGKPLSVQVFTKDPELPANRFVNSKNRPQINPYLDCYALRLLYETDKDDYFVSDLEAAGSLAGYSVMRLQKSEIVRIDYITPKWVRWRGVP